MVTDLVGPADRVVVRMATVCIVVQLAVRGWIGLQGYFRVDDFAFVARSGGYSLLDPEYLFTYYAGHLMPGSMVWVWVTSRIDAYNYGLVVTTLVLAQLVASVLVLRMLRVLFGDRPLILVPLALYLFSPLTLESFLWWSAAINALPLQIGLALAITAHVRYLQTGRRRHIATATAAVAGSLLFFEKSVLIIPLLFGISWLWDTTTGPLRALGRALRTQWPAWLTYLALLTAHLQVYTRLEGRWSLLTPPPLATPDPAAVLRALWLGGTRTFLPGLLGGPFRWGPDWATATTRAPTWLILLSGVVLVGLVVGSGWRSRRARRAWLVGAGYVLGSVLLFALGRPNTGQLITQPRYWADSLLVTAFVLALATIPARMAPPDRLRTTFARRRTAWVWWPVAASLAVVFLVVSAVSTSGFLMQWQRSDSRQWLTTALSAMHQAAGSRQTLLDNIAPGNVVSPWLYPWKQYSWTFSAVRDRPPITQVSWQLLTFDATGALVPGRIEGPGWAGVRCLPPGEAEMTLPLSALVYPWVHQAHLRFYASEPVRAQVSLDNEPVSLALGPGHSDVYFTIQGGGTSVRVGRADSGQVLCVSGFQVGAVVPTGGSG